ARQSGKIAEAAVCYTGDILDDSRAKYSVQYYKDMAKELEAAGAHILAIKRALPWMYEQQKKSEW
ncbi:hypothetical protein, partial [Lysinibacillus fusiformis]|uniref:hypothetical protein n=1 Tax=Lysinibacillus fusiformis TaxID=28031 RepID=UPI003B97C7DF